MKVYCLLLSGTVVFENPGKSGMSAGMCPKKNQIPHCWLFLAMNNAGFSFQHPPKIKDGLMKGRHAVVFLLAGFSQWRS